MTTKLTINKIAGETTPEFRRRTARAIVELFRRDDLLREEVAMILDIASDQLELNGLRNERPAQLTTLVEIGQ